MAKTVQLTFYITLTDQDQVLAYQAQYPNGVIRGPQPAAVEFSAPYQTADVPAEAPCTRTQWAPYASANKFFYDRAVFTISGGGFFGWLGLSSTRFVWVGQFVYAPSGSAPIPPPEGNTGPPGDPVETAPIPQRKWIHGFELHGTGGSQESGEGATGIGQPNRVSSRVVDGLGQAIRSASTTITQLTNEFTGGAANAKTWERLYIRLHRASTLNVPFWRVIGAPGGSTGIKVYVTPTGALAVYSVNAGSVETLEFTSALLVIGAVTKLDLTVWFKSSAGKDYVQFTFWINCIQVFSGVSLIRDPAGAAPTHASTQIANTGGGHSLELDIDDWIGAELPGRFTALAWTIGDTYALDAYVTYGGKIYRSVAGGNIGNQPPNATWWIQSIGPVDFFSGSHVLTVHPLSFGAANNAAAWPGNIRTLMRLPLNGVGTPNLASATSGGVLEVNTDATNYAQSAVAIAVGVHGAHTGSGASLGVGVAGGAPSMQLVPQDGSARWASVLYRPSGLIAPQVVNPLTIRYTKAPNVTAATVQGLFATIEYIGVFDKCDAGIDPTITPAPATPAYPRQPGIHNAPYPTSPWVQTSTPPMAGVWVKTGTYVGNDVGADVIVQGVPAHLLWIRPQSGPNGGVKWLSTMLQAGHVGLDTSPNTTSLSLAVENTAYVSAGGAGDPEEQYFERIAVNNSQSNVNPTVYQYMIFSDPSARFLLNGALAHGTNALDASVADALADASFTPTFGLLWQEFFSNGDTTANFYGKGPGHATNAGSLLNAAQNASLAAFSAGQITTKAALHSSGQSQVAYALARTSDAPISTSVAFQILSYVGDGNATQVITLTPTSGKRPLFAIIIPTDSASWFRDPGHLTGKSSTVSMGAPAANGLVAGGIDQITVGISLNALGVSYSVLVIPGSTTAGIDGWSIDGEFILSDPAMPGGTQFDPTVFTEPDIDVAADADSGALYVAPVLGAVALTNQISLTWSGAGGATSYTVKRGLSTGTEVPIASGVVGTSYLDSGLTNGVQYFYVITAFYAATDLNPSGTSAASNEVSATPTTSPIPPSTAPVTILAGRLGDPDFIRYTVAEVAGYLREALRTYNALTNTFRNRATFDTTMATTFYDLQTVLTPAIRTPILTTYSLIADLERTLMEPPTPAAWTGTDQFTLATLNAAIERRRDLFLRETGIVLTTATQLIASPAANGRLSLADRTIAIRRATWTPSATLIAGVLQRDDEWGANHYAPAWTTPGVPSAYSVAAVPRLTMQLIPPAAAAGRLDLVQITCGIPCVSGAATALGVPDDWVWVLKWGALADLLAQDGLSYDPARAAHCEARWNQGLSAAKAAAVVLAAEIDGVPCQVATLNETDAYGPYWDAVAGTPLTLITAGQTLVAVAPPAGAKVGGGEWTVTLDVVCNAPVPVADSDPLLIGPELLDPILDYAEYLAIVKEGMAQIEAAMPLLNRFMATCGVTLKLQQAEQPNRVGMLQQVDRDESTVPRILSPVDAGGR